MNRIRTMTVVALGVLALLALAGAEVAKAADDYFKGNVIELILPNSPTGRMAQ